LNSDIAYRRITLLARKRKPKEPAPSPIAPKNLTKRHSLSLKHLLAMGLIAAMVLVAYANAFRVPFQFDDWPNILENPDVQIKIFSLDRLEQLARNTYPVTIRIFAYFTFALNYYLGRFDVFGYHLVNLLIHITSGVLLYWLLMLTFSLPSLKDRYGSKAFSIALFSSLLFVVHPIQTQSVTYIVQRMTSMAGMFYLLGMLLYVKGRLSEGTPRALYWIGMVLSYLFGLFSKENVAILPFYVALYELCFFRNLDVSPKGKKIFIYLIGGLFFIGVLMFFFWGKRYLDVIIEDYKIRDFTLTERVLTQFRVVLYYVTLLLFPHPSRLNLDYDFPISRGIFDPPATLLSIIIVLGLVGYGIWTMKKTPLLSFCIFWYFGNLVIESSIFPLEMVFEHRLYLPSIGPFVLFATFAVRGWEEIKKRLRLRLNQDTTRTRFGTETSLRVRAPSADVAGDSTDYRLWSLFLVVAVLLGWGSYERNKVWKNEITLWEDCVKKSPHKPRVHNNLGSFLVKDKKFERGIEELNIALKLDPRYNEARFNLGLAYGKMKLFDRATIHLAEYLRTNPERPEGYNEMGLVSLQKRKIDEAIRFFKRGLEINPGDARIHANLGNAYLQGEMLDEAIFHYKKAMSYDLNLTSLHVKLAEAYQKKGLPDQAMEETRKALQIDPSLHEAHAAIGATYLQQGRIDEAIAELKKALRVDSKDPNIYNNLGVAYRRKNLLDEAIANYKKALNIDSSFADARVNLGEVYFGKGMVEEATSELEHAVRIAPEKAEVHSNLGVIYLQKKRMNEAISSFKRAITLNPKYGNAYFNLAVAYYYEKDIPSASFYARKALELGYEVDPKLLKELRIRQ
jgi:tetratricopeptide (TPR) repeat protein